LYLFYDRPAVLKLIESTAKADGDLGTENDARYEIQVLASNKYSLALRVLDWVFYRQIAGYLVRPLHPLIAWLTFVALLAGYRLTRRKDLLTYPWSRPHRRLPRRIAALGVGAVRSLEEFAEGLSSVGPRRPDEAGQKRSALEANISRALVACIVVGLASADPTLSQVVHAF